MVAFAFQVLPKVIYFSTCITVLYYLGVMQVIIVIVGWLLQAVLSTSAGESLNAAGNIFFGQVLNAYKFVSNEFKLDCERRAFSRFSHFAQIFI